MSDPFEQNSATRLMIFGHPAHELALFGLLQRHRPAVVVITDGGAASGSSNRDAVSTLSD